MTIAPPQFSYDRCLASWLLLLLGAASTAAAGCGEPIPGELGAPPEPAVQAAALGVDLALDGSDNLRPRVSFQGLKRKFSSSDLAYSWKNRIEVKFREGTGVRARDGKLSIAPRKVLEATSPVGELAVAASVLSDGRDYVATRIAPLPEDSMDELRLAGQAISGKQLSDLNLWYYIYLEAGGDKELASLLNELNALSIVEIAYPCSMSRPSTEAGEDRLPVPTGAELADREVVSANGVSVVPRRPQAVPQPETGSAADVRAVGNYQSQQVYLSAAPAGMDVQWLRSRYSWNMGQGQKIGIVDAEWDALHREFTTGSRPPNFVLVAGHPEPAPLTGYPYYRPDDFNHGTATLGIIASTPDDNLGTSGILPRADGYLLASWTGVQDDAGTIFHMIPSLYQGSAIAIEYGRDSAGIDCSGDGLGHDHVPLETDPAVWSAIEAATALDISVVEAAGNGSCDLDLIAGLNVELNEYQDSGAIMVAASYRDRTKWTTSNYGSRIDANAEGSRTVVSTGYGDLYPASTPAPLNQVHEWYTARYVDTSSATPQVAAAVAHLNAIAYSYHGTYLPAATLREIVRQSGTTPAPSALEIGRRPNLKKQVARVENFFLSTRATNYVGGASAPGPDYMNWDQGTSLWNVKDPINGNSTNFTFGQPGQIPVIADFHSGNGTLADIVVYDPPTGQWIRYLGPGGYSQILGTSPAWSVPIPVECNSAYYGPELAVFKPYATSGYGNPNGKSEFVIRRAPPPAFQQIVEWGDALAYGIPLAGDFMGDTKDEIVVVNPHAVSGQLSDWHVLSYPYDPDDSPSTSFQFGEWNDLYLTCKVPNPSGKATRAAVYRPSQGRFIVRVPEEPTGKRYSAYFGKPGDVPTCMDVDGNGTDDFVLWRPGERRWYRNTSESYTYVSTATEDSYAMGR